MVATHADQLARETVGRVLDSPEGRLELLRHLYETEGLGSRHLPYRRAATAFMQWQIRRGLLTRLSAPAPGSPWWRAVNGRLLQDTAEARYLASGVAGAPTSSSVAVALEFIKRPSAARWYRAHNLSVVEAYLENHALAEQEDRVERFFINLVLLRVLYAHALVAAPRLALGWLSPFAATLGDPRLGMTGIFLSLTRVLPDRYPLGDDVAPYAGNAHGFGRLLDLGVIQPRLRELYDWSARELAVPELANLLVDGVPSYAWNPTDAEHWYPPIRGLAAIGRRLVPVTR